MSATLPVPPKRLHFSTPDYIFPPLDCMSIPFLRSCAPSAEEVAAVKRALTDAGFIINEPFKSLHTGASTAKLSMPSPREGDVSPRTLASTHCPPGFGMSSMSRIEGNSSNGMFGKGLDLMNGHTIREYYMTRLLVDGIETFVPIQIEVRLEKSGSIFGKVLGAEF
jgi:hypothetical protein